MNLFKNLLEYIKTKFNWNHVEYTNNELLFVGCGIVTCLFVLSYMGIL